MTDESNGRKPDFELADTPVMSRSTVDKSEQVRDTPGNPEKLWRNGRVILVDPRGQVEIDEGDRLHAQPASDFGVTPPEGMVLLGADGDLGYWAIRTPRDGSEEGWQTLRTVAALLDDTDAGLMTTAVALLNWHEQARFCTVCGASTTPIRTGWVRECTGCGREEYPRTDAAVICLVHDGGDRVLLARQPNWPAQRYSVLAGFVEVGESLEACVRREIGEEVGIEVDQVRYLGSQPWPFPRSLMLGFAAVGDPEAPLRPAEGEIGDARWVRREQVIDVLEAEGEAVHDLRMPPGSSIAYSMLRSWAYWRD